MKAGFYWVSIEGQEPEVVEIQKGMMYRVGAEDILFLSENVWYFSINSSAVFVEILSEALKPPY